MVPHSPAAIEHPPARELCNRPLAPKHTAEIIEEEKELPRDAYNAICVHLRNFAVKKVLRQSQMISIHRQSRGYEEGL